ncbi:MAG: hypothetical protein H5T68_03505 [Chloroflexi bacterium]|nr:hypothetical protein [Chloroflexota bacterium]
MSTTEPIEQLKRDIDAIGRAVNALHAKVRLGDLRDAVEDLHTDIANLPNKVRDLRTRGYPFEKGLEERASDFAQQWASLRPMVLAQIEQQAMALEFGLRPIEDQFRRLVALSAVPQEAQFQITQIKAALSSLESKVSATQNQIRGMYDALERQVREFHTHLQRVDWMLKQLAEATFPLLPTEAGIMAVKATWVKGEKEDKSDPQGILYLTDQRLLFEQKQEIATKKMLFITREKEKVQKLLLEVPLDLIETVKASKRGFLGHEDHIEFTFAPDAPTMTAHFHIDGQDCNAWQGLVGRAKAKEFDQDRAVALDQAVVEKVRSAPTVCPYCGGAITTQVLRGMDSIRCEYCGKVIRW